MSMWGWGPTLILAGVWEEVTLQNNNNKKKGSDLKKCGYTGEASSDPHPHPPGSALAALGNTSALCLENHGHYLSLTSKPLHVLHD